MKLLEKMRDSNLPKYRAKVPVDSDRHKVSLIDSERLSARCECAFLGNGSKNEQRKRCPMTALKDRKSAALDECLEAIRSW